MLDHRQHIAELDRLQSQSNAVRRTLSGLRNGVRNVLELSAQLGNDLSALRARIANAEPKEAEHDDESAIAHH